MRISDWSSDVCSSDLCLGLRAPCVGMRQPHAVAGVTLTIERCHRAVADRSRKSLRRGLRRRLVPCGEQCGHPSTERSEEHTSELQSLMRISYAVFCLKKKKNTHKQPRTKYQNNKT